MPRHIAFLRGINVGGHRVKMDELRRLFGELSFSDVSTFIASGNVVFESPDEDRAGLEREIEGRFEEDGGQVRAIPRLATPSAFQSDLPPLHAPPSRAYSP